ncbi:MAG: hypothetical protein QG623_422 [Patescibacteria group bacterium]|nr:hypothetical protein [Patescibacteria group bacterium]MDQ5913803.1 hypothetical protein [Patescibacteria group bacterium]
MNQSVEQVNKYKLSLLRYTGLMVLFSTILQIIIALRGNQIDFISQLLLALIAVYYFWYHYTTKDQLSKLRFGRLVAHLIGFLVVNLSYHIHAFVLFVTSNPAIKGTDGFSIDPSWFGVLFGMFCFWGIGLLIHLVASVANRGFEELSRG